VIRRVIIIGVAILAILVSGLGFLLLSQTGLGIVVSIGTQVSGHRFRVGETSGSLISSPSLRDITIRTPGADITIDRFDLRWTPAKLFSGNLHVAEIRAERVIVALNQSGPGTKTRQGSGAQKDLSLPVGVLLGELSLYELVVRADDGRELMHVQEAKATLAGAHDEVRIGRAMLRTPSYGGELVGDITLSGSRDMDITGQWWAIPDGCEKFAGTFSLAGPLASPDFFVNLIRPADVQVRGQLPDILEVPGWQVKGEGQSDSLAAICTGMPDAKVRVEIESTGSPDDYRALLTIQAEAEQGLAASVTAELTGDQSSIVVSSGRVESAGQGGQFSGTLSWNEGISWDAQANLPLIDLSAFGLDYDIRVSGAVGTDGHFSNGALSYRADIADLKGQLLFPSADFSGSARLNGGESGLQIDATLKEAGGGLLDVSGEIGWFDGLSWDSKITLQQFDPSIFPRVLEGSVDLELQTAGNLGQTNSFSVIITSLAGNLAGHELTGGGRLEFRDNRFDARDLYVKTNDNILRVEGSLEDELGVDFDFSGPEFGQLIPQLGGSVSLSGSLSGDLSSPMLQFTGSGRDLSFEGNRVAELEGSGNIALTDMTPFAVDIAFSNLRAQEYDVTSGTIIIAGNREKHTLSVDVQTDGQRVSLLGEGSLSGEPGWSGTLEQFSYDHDIFGLWRQQGSVAVDVSAGAVRLENLCIFSATGNLCARGGWESSGTWFIEVPEFEFQLAELNRWDLLDTSINGFLNGRFQAQGQGSVLRELSGKLEVPELSMNVDLGGMYPDFRWLGTGITFDLSAETLDIGVRSRFVDGSMLSGSLFIGGITDVSQLDLDLPVTGYLKADLNDLSPLALVTDDYLIPSGSIAAELSVSGTIGEPSVSGDVELNGGELRMPALGMVITDLNGTLRGRGQGLDFSLEGNSGEGFARVTGRMDFSNGSWSGSFNGTGRNFELLNQRELTIAGDPDVYLEIGPDGGTLTGMLLVRQALLAPEEMVSSVSESRDVVFVDAEQSEQSWPFTYDIEMILGDEVRVAGYGLEGNLVGQVRVRQPADGPLRGRGEISVAGGTFTIFGRALNISRGRIIFSGGAIDNPGLDISARKIVANDRSATSEIVVGINIIGTVHDYEVELFSIPAMEDRDILAYILLDQSFISSDNSSKGVVDKALAGFGVGSPNALFSGVTEIMPVDELHFEGGLGDDDASLVVGKSLTEQLSVSYDFNLFKNAGFFRVRYEFGRGFSVQSRNSFDSNGIEFLYSFER
jgi:translocation and assembly module TamB